MFAPVTIPIVKAKRGFDETTFEPETTIDGSNCIVDCKLKLEAIVLDSRQSQVVNDNE